MSSGTKKSPSRNIADWPNKSYWESQVYICGPMTGIPEFNYPAFDAQERELRRLGFDSIENPADNFGRRTDLERKDYMKEAIEAIRVVDLISLLPGWKHSEGALLELQIARALEIPVYSSKSGSLFDLTHVPLGQLLDEARDRKGIYRLEGWTDHEEEIVSYRKPRIIQERPGKVSDEELSKIASAVYEYSWVNHNNKVPSGSPLCIPCVNTQKGRISPREEFISNYKNKLKAAIEFNQQTPTRPKHESILSEATRITAGDRQRDYNHPLPNHKAIGEVWGTLLEGYAGGPVPPRKVAAMMVGLKLVRDVYTPKRDNAVDIAGYAFCMDEITHAEEYGIDGK